MRFRALRPQRFSNSHQRCSTQMIALLAVREAQALLEQRR